MNKCPKCKTPLTGNYCPCGWKAEKKTPSTYDAQYYADIERNKSSPETSAKWLAKMRSKIGGYRPPKSKRHENIKFTPIPDEIKDIVEADDKKQDIEDIV